ncbi:hypothetical protein [Micromonospora sp. NPDC050276]|uniref:hypothetical protein n=1 Tax=Micromonospora sp. NPDC050276 TaxID=3364278 RepID=UPI0037B153F9
MTVDEELGRALTELTKRLTPEPDPYGRVRARYRRGRQRRLGGLALALVVATGGTAFAVAGPGRTTQPPPTDSTESIAPVVAWSNKLLQSPPRGAVAQDSHYVRQLSDTLLSAQRRGDFPRLSVPLTDSLPPEPVPVSAVKVIFVDDVGGKRIALAAFVREKPDQVTGWPSAAVWLVADAGASAAKLASTASVQGVSDALEPYESLAVDGAGPGKPLQLAIAPADCVFLRSPLPDGGTFQWTPEPTGSYLIRLPQDQRPEWWRVDCGEVTRLMTAAPGSLVSKPITDDQLVTALAGGRGTVDEPRARELMYQWAQSAGYHLTALPRVVWGGKGVGVPSGTANGPQSPGEPSVGSARVTVLAAPAVGGGWIGEVTIDPDRPRSDGAVSTGASFTVMTDPTDPGSLLAVQVDDDAVNEEGRQSVLVVTPTAATSVRALRDGQEIARADVVGSGAMLTVPGPTANLVVEALDTAGAKLTAGRVADRGAQAAPAVDAWNQD